jgi:hypothetical protein
MNIDISDVNNKHDELHDAFLQIFQGRSNFQLDNFVVGAHMTDERQYAQCVIELQHKYFNIRRADITRKKLIQEINECEDEFKKEEKVIDLQETEISIIGALREFYHLYEIFKNMPKFTAEQLETAESKYWLKRLTTQSQIDIESQGSIGPGNAEALRQIDLINGHSSRFMHLIKDHPGVNEIVQKIAKEVEEDNNKE